MTAPRKRSFRLKRLSKLMLGFAVLGMVAFWKQESLLRVLVYHKPVHLDEAFHEAIAEADRIDIRRGGFDCCEPVNSDPVLFTVSGRAAVKQIASHIHLQSLKITDSSELGECGCCGYPGMDWYRGQKRVALTSVHHGKALRWGGFSTTRIMGRTVGYADAPLMPESGAWLTNWLAEHGASEAQLDSPRDIDANNSAAGNAGIALMFAVKHGCPGLPEPRHSVHIASP